jgi:hypothetical protein
MIDESTNNMTQKNNLLALIGDDADQMKRFEQKKVEVTKDKESLSSHARSFLTKYNTEIKEGDKKKQLLLQEGRSVEEIQKIHGFIPSSATPIMNFLYFADRDKDYDNNPTILLEENDLDKDLEELTEHYNLKYGHLNDSYSDESPRENAPPAMESFIYTNMSHDTFVKIKKLKALTKSPNEAEAFQAYRKCTEFCKKYNLDFDRIPS